MVNDPFHLARFIEAQAEDYERALKEVRQGRKQSHWMWFVFPQFHGLGLSATSRHFAIGSREEARAYLEHELLGPRLMEISEAALAVTGKSATEVFGSPDDLKLRSSATLFAAVSPAPSVFHRLLDHYFDGIPDAATEQLLGEKTQ